MIKLFNESEFNSARATDKLKFECVNCGNIFYKEKRFIQQAFNGEQKRKIIFCSKKCQFESQRTRKEINCDNCGTKFLKKQSQIKKSKSGKHFCSQSCSASYNNKHKKHGNRRSKLELWLEDQLNMLYPNMNILFNDKETIGSELDIHIPSLNIAFELNGIFHYEPIYGIDKLHQIQENDQSKSKACHDAKIDLCVIDTSQQKYFKPKTSQKYLDIITTIINQRTTLNS